MRRICVLILAFVAGSFAFSQGLYQNLDIIRKAEKGLTWRTMSNVFATKLKDGDGPDDCVDRLSTAANNFMSNPDMAAFAMYSGKNVYDLGDYLGCKKSNGSYYLQMHVHLVSSYDLTIRMSFCLPKACSVDYLNVKKPEFSKVLTDFFNTTIHDGDLTFMDIIKNNEEANRIGLGFCCTIFFFCSMALACIILTTLDVKGMIKGTSKGMQIAQAFSFKKNLVGLFSNENRVDPKLNLFNGVRVLSICWVVLNHSWLTLPYDSIFNLSDAVFLLPLKLMMSIVKAAPLSVDAFFVLSGFLCALGLCSAFKDPKNRTIPACAMAILNRFLRFFPMHLTALLYTLFILPTVADSPNNIACYEHLTKPCQTQWPLTLLHINNFFATFNSMCMSWTWYLNVDMQFFILTIPLILIYFKNKRWCYALMGVLAAISIAAQTYLCIEHKLHKSYVKAMSADMLTLFFIKPYCRINTYMIGMLLYFAYDDSKKEVGKESLPWKPLQHWVCDFPVVRYLFYLLGTSIMLFVVYSTYLVDKYADSYTDLMGALDVIISRPLFVIGFAMVIYPVLVGKGKFILSILAFPMFGPLAKLTFGVYILHLQFYFHNFQFEYHYFYYSDEFYIYRILGITLAGFALSFIVSMIIEVPCMHIQKILLVPQRALPAKPKPEKKEDDEKKLTPEVPVTTADGDSPKKTAE